MRSKSYKGKKWPNIHNNTKGFSSSLMTVRKKTKWNKIHSVEDIKITYIKLNWLSKRLITDELLHLDNFVNEINANRKQKLRSKQNDSILFYIRLVRAFI